MDDRDAQQARMKVGEAVRTLRVAHGLTQSELGEAMGLGQSQLSILERGERLLDDVLIFTRMADALGISRVGLFTLVARAVPKRRGERPESRSPEYPDEVRPQDTTTVYGREG